MNEQQRARAEDVFHRALERPAPERKAFAEAACGVEPEVLSEVLSLLDAADGADGYFAAVAEGVGAPFSTDASEAEVRLEHTRIGPYRLVRELGRGGSGSVYLAERVDGEFEQQAAIKLLRRGLDTDDIVARFRAERQILASLNHPHIARLYDGGVADDGRPYLVMEPVDGQPITAHCDARCSTIEERLRLFVRVARAVQYAHRQLVVHRDIKPSNILVTDDGTPKLLDFGIARLLEDAEWSPHTRTGVRLLTPEYASPEQLRGEPISTASDAYQLGMLLYRLLVDRSPYRLRNRSPAAIDSAIREQEPDPPGVVLGRPASAAGEPSAAEIARLRGTELRRLAARLRGDLDTILVKAVRKEPGRRYASAGELADDIERYLAGRPVAARPDTWTYRTWKLLRRRPAVAAAAMAAVLAGAVYTATLRTHAHQLERERNVARLESARANETQQFLVDLFRTADPLGSERPDAGADMTVRAALAAGVERVRTELQDQPQLQATLLGTIAGVYANLELFDEALRLREQAVAIETRLWGDESAQVAATFERIGSIFWQQRRFDEAYAYFDRYTAVATTLYGEGSPEAAKGYARIASAYEGRGEFEQAEASYQRAVRAYRRAGPEHAEALASTLSSLAGLYQVAYRAAEAEAAAREALVLWESALGPEHPQTAVTLMALALPVGSQGRVDEAEGMMRRALSIFEARLGPEHSYTIATLNNLANAVARRGDVAEAVHIHRSLLASRSAKWGADHAATIQSMQNLAAVLSRLEAYDEAAALAAEAHESFLRVKGPGHVHTALPLLTLAEIRLKQNDWQGAAAAASDARALLSEALPEGHFITALAAGRLGRALAGQQRHAEAEALLEESLRTLTAAGAEAELYAEEIRAALSDLQ